MSLENEEVPSRYIDVIKDMYDGVWEQVEGEMEPFLSPNSLHQGLVKNPWSLYFSYRWTYYAYTKISWCMLFVTILC